MIAWVVVQNPIMLAIILDVCMIKALWRGLL